MLTRRDTNHFGHFVLTILFWPWLIAWIMFYTSNQRHNAEVDRLLWEASQKSLNRG